MKNILSTLLLVISAVLFSHGNAIAGDRGTQEEAMALVKKAINYVKKNGKEKALAEFSSQTGQFKDRDLYVGVLDVGGMALAHGGNAKMVGKSMIDLKDADGKQFIKEIINTASSRGNGWVDYKWVNPTSKAIEHKTTYVEKMDDMVFICGVYKE